MFIRNAITTASLFTAVFIAIFLSGCATTETTWRNYDNVGNLTSEVIKKEKASLLKDKELEFTALGGFLKIITMLDPSTMSLSPTFEAIWGKTRTSAIPTRGMSYERLSISRNCITNYMTDLDYEHRSSDNGNMMPSSVKITAMVDAAKTSSSTDSTITTIPEIPSAPILPAIPEKADIK